MKIVVLDGYTLNPGDLSWKRLLSMGDVVLYDRTPGDKILERAAGAEILFTNKTPLREEIINNLPSLKFIGLLATGYDNVDTEAARRKGIIVTNAPGYATASVAQMTFALLLELCNHVQRHSDSAMKGKWTVSADFCYWDYPLIELAGKTIGIIGFGKIGEKVGDIATAFGMNILGMSKVQNYQSRRKNFKWALLDEVLEQADVISIHCPLVPDTKGLINTSTLMKMKKSAFLLNTSRGAIVVAEDLADALNNDIIAGAATDVLSVEPPDKDNPLFKARNCIITPHISWATKEARTRLMDIALNNLSSFLNGKPANIVNGR